MTAESLHWCGVGLPVILADVLVHTTSEVFHSLWRENETKFVRVAVLVPREMSVCVCGGGGCLGTKAVSESVLRKITQVVR